ncbi:MAG: hypothetical protein M3288_02570, partial [Thermoproteota archaeon]|nr:hypothetical protein [Thermoproteota archaeon]
MTVLSLSGFYLVVAEWLVTMSSTKHNQIQFRAEITIQEGKIEEYKKVVQEMSRVVEANEP